MAKRTALKKTAKKSAKTMKKGKARKAPAKKKAAPKPSSSKKAAAKRAARLKAIEKARIAEETAAATINYAPAPFEAPDADPSKAPGKQHRRPPMSLVGVKHSEAYIAKARTKYVRKFNMGT